MFWSAHMRLRAFQNQLLTSKQINFILLSINPFSNLARFFSLFFAYPSPLRCLIFATPALTVPPEEPRIFDAQGKEIAQMAGPFREGYELFLCCQVKGGKWFVNVSPFFNQRIQTHNGMRVISLCISTFPICMYIWVYAVSCRTAILLFRASVVCNCMLA